MQVAQGIEMHTDQDVVNWFLVETDDGLVAVDAGFPTAWEEMDERVDELVALVLTHGHIDHCGFAPKVAERGIPVYVPHGDEPIVQSPLPMAESEGSRLKYVVKESATRSLYLKALKAGGVKGQTLHHYTVYRDGDTLPGGLRAIATPGHTDGHMALHLPSRDVVFVGDAIVTVDPYTELEGPRLVARAATADVERNVASLDAIAATGASLVLTGHGPPWTEGAATAVEQARANGAA
jgi:glyoxylase-like metal-dependent hydrolase (beta-lactamase superfamily II)